VRISILYRGEVTCTLRNMILNEFIKKIIVIFTKVVQIWVHLYHHPDYSLYFPKIPYNLHLQITLSLLSISPIYTPIYPLLQVEMETLFLRPEPRDISIPIGFLKKPGLSDGSRGAPHRNIGSHDGLCQNLSGRHPRPEIH